jgi:hypothetical protein
MNKSENFRRRIEEKEAIEVVKPLEQKYGVNAWAMKLRMSPCHKIEKYNLVGSPVNGIYSKISEKQGKELEIISRPFSSYNSSYNKYNHTKLSKADLKEDSLLYIKSQKGGPNILR